MTKPFKKALLLCVSTYSLNNSMLEILSEMSEECKAYDIREEIGELNLKIQTQIYRFPHFVRRKWERQYLFRINSRLISEIRSYDPDLVLVYNSEYLLPETCNEIKRRAKLIFFMGDSPFFTHVNDYYLPCLIYADLVLSPDTFWISQLNTIGIHQTAFFAPGLDKTTYYPIDDKTDLQDIEAHEVIYSGSSYKNSWGFKKALLMSQFTGFNFRIYGNSSWERWFEYFPELKDHFTKTGFIPVDRLNKMYNRSKLMPVDGNPGILNGFHIRLFEALGAGILPLVEYRSDVEDILFRGCDAKVPFIKNYKQAGNLARYFVVNEDERVQTARALREFIISEYNAAKNAERLHHLLNKFK